MSSTGSFPKNFFFIGYIFEQLDKIIYKIEIINYESFVSFLVSYVAPAWNEKKSCVITTDDHKVFFYLEQGEVIFPLDSNWNEKLKMMIEG